MAMYGATIGAVSILGIYATTNQACACATTFKNCLHFYLYYFLIYSKNTFVSHAKGGAQPNISQTMIRNFPINLPTLPEQKEIVRILDAVFFAEKEAEKKVDTVLNDIDLIKKSILARAFRGKLNTNDPKEPAAKI